MPKINKEIKYSIKMPLFSDEATNIWKEMPDIIKGIVEKKHDAIEKFNRLDAIINGGNLVKVGMAFGKPIYTRIEMNDKDLAEYEAKRLASFMNTFLTEEPENIEIGGYRYTVVLKEKI